MADWPDTTELAQVLDVSNVEDWQTTLDRTMASAIARVKLDIGVWDEDTDTPTDMQAAAALRMGELLALRPEAAAEASRDPTYQRLLFGSRKRFGIS